MTDLTTGSVGRRLMSLTLPMIAGMFSIVAFNLADAFFVARLGVRELAAMSFTFPVVMLLGTMGVGLGTGAGAVISQAIGEGDERKVRRLTTDSLFLSLIIVVAMALMGLATMKPAFKMMGAAEDLYPLIKEYMLVWYLGMIFLIVPMVGNSAIRASGDTKFPSLIMMIAALVNIVLDPLLIFGLLGFPRLGLLGAAVATVVSRAAALTASLTVLHFRKKMLDSSIPPLRDILISWKKILHIGIPAAATNMLIPVSMGAITRIAAKFGPEAVAAVGAGTRIESFSFMIVMALAASVVPLIGQNWGARKSNRIRQAITLSNQYAFWWGTGTMIVFFLLGNQIAVLFTDNPTVSENIALYLLIVPIGYGLRGVATITSAAFNAVNRPVAAAMLSIVRTLVLTVPIAWIGAEYWGIKGLFSGMGGANILAGTLAFYCTRRGFSQNISKN